MGQLQIFISVAVRWSRDHLRVKPHLGPTNCCLCLDRKFYQPPHHEVQIFTLAQQKINISFSSYEASKDKSIEADLL